MHEGNFSLEKEKKERELFRQKLEESFIVKSDPTMPLDNLLVYVKEKHRIMFIVDDNFNIVLTRRLHGDLLTTLKVNERDCMISTGSFELRNGAISFSYHEYKQVIDVIPEAAQKAIKKFLQSKGIEVLN